VSTTTHNDESFRISLVGPRETRNANRTAGFAASVILHGLVLLLLFVAGQHGLQASPGGAQFIPVEVVEVGDDMAAPAQRGTPVQSQQQVARRLPSDPTPLDDAPLASQPPTGEPEADPLEAKLQTLAKLRQPDADMQTGSSGTDLPATNDGAAFGLEATYRVRDFIRAQVERRWHFDLAALGTNQFSVPIHVEITSTGSVIKAEIVDTPHSGDPAYDEVALSARNAVLLASPFSLPAGHYQDVMDVVLYLDPKGALR
jgi:hypothetical protein